MPKLLTSSAVIGLDYWGGRIYFASVATGTVEFERKCDVYKLDIGFQADVTVGGQVGLMLRKSAGNSATDVKNSSTYGAYGEASINAYIKAGISCGEHPESCSWYFEVGPSSDLDYSFNVDFNIFEIGIGGSLEIPNKPWISESGLLSNVAKDIRA